MAGSRCTVCDHPERKAIETASAVSSLRNIEKQWGVSYQAVRRHKAKHLQPAVARAIARREEVGAEALLDKLQSLLDKLEESLNDAHQKGDHAATARVAKEMRETIVRLGQATRGLWATSPQTVIDARRQTVNIGPLSLEDLRALAEDARRRLSSGHPEAEAC
jgi:hypothetical protein